MSRKIGFKDIWNCLFPIILFLVVMGVVHWLLFMGITATPLTAIIPKSIDVVVQGLTYVVLIIILNIFFTRKNNMYANKKNLHFGFILMAIFIVLLAGIGLNYIISRLGYSNYDVRYTTIRDTYYGADFWIQILVLGIVVPMGEELMYRGVLYRRLRVLGTAPVAVFISAAIFGLLHFNLVQGIYGFLMGIILAVIMEKKDNIIFTCAGHMALNIFTLVDSKVGLGKWIANTGANMLIVGIVALVVSIVLLIIFAQKRR